MMDGVTNPKHKKLNQKRKAIKQWQWQREDKKKSNHSNRNNSS